MTAHESPASQPLMGWQCPSCGGVYSPSTAKCWVCPPVRYGTDTQHNLSRCTHCGLPVGLCRGHTICGLGEPSNAHITYNPDDASQRTISTNDYRSAGSASS